MTKDKKVGLDKFEATVLRISQRLAPFPDDKSFRQEFISFTPVQLYELRAVTDLWREKYNSANYAEVIAICCKFFREYIENDEKQA